MKLKETYLTIDGRKYRIWLKSKKIQSIQVFFVRNQKEMSRNISPDGEIWHSLSELIRRQQNEPAAL